MKVLHLVYNLIRGGTEGQCARVAMALARRGHSQRIAVFRREGYFIPMVEEACVQVMELEIRHMISLVTVREVKRLRDLIHAESFDLVHAWDADAAIFGSIAACWAGVPFITSRRDLGEIYPAYKLWLMHLADRKAAAVVVNAKAIEHSPILHSIDPQKIHLINNVLDVEEFNQLTRITSDCYLPSSKNVVMVARLNQEKGIAVLVRAFKLVLQQCDDVNLIIVGDGIERAPLEQLVQTLGISSNVYFLGARNDVPAILSKCDIGVLVPLSNEGLSNTIIEYMAAQLPVVATECGGNSELVNDGVNGYIVPINDHIAVSNALLRLLNDEQKAQEMGMKGRKRIEAEFDVQNVVPKFEALYQAVLKSKKSS